MAAIATQQTNKRHVARQPLMLSPLLEMPPVQCPLHQCGFPARMEGSEREPISPGGEVITTYAERGDSDGEKRQAAMRSALCEGDDPDQEGQVRWGAVLSGKRDHADVDGDLTSLA